MYVCMYVCIYVCMYVCVCLDFYRVLAWAVYTSPRLIKAREHLIRTNIQKRFLIRAESAPPIKTFIPLNFNTAFHLWADGVYTPTRVYVNSGAGEGKARVLKGFLFVNAVDDGVCIYVRGAIK